MEPQLFDEAYNIATKYYSFYFLDRFKYQLLNESRQLLKFVSIKYENEDEKNIIMNYYKRWIDEGNNNIDGNIYFYLCQAFICNLISVEHIPIIRKYINNILQYHPEGFMSCDDYYIFRLNMFCNKNYLNNIHLIQYLIENNLSKSYY